jgi:hypothetical protein
MILIDRARSLVHWCDGQRSKIRMQDSKGKISGRKTRNSDRARGNRRLTRANGRRQCRRCGERRICESVFYGDHPIAVRSGRRIGPVQHAFGARDASAGRASGESMICLASWFALSLPVIAPGRHCVAYGVALTEFVLKPLVGRTIRGYPASPAGIPPFSRWPPSAGYCWPDRSARACRVPCGCCW